MDTTVQGKHIRFPTDPRLYDRMRQRLVAAARREGPAQAVIRSGGQAPARPAEPLRPRQTVEAGA